MRSNAAVTTAAAPPRMGASCAPAMLKAPVRTKSEKSKYPLWLVWVMYLSLYVVPATQSVGRRRHRPSTTSNTPTIVRVATAITGLEWGGGLFWGTDRLWGQ